MEHVDYRRGEDVPVLDFPALFDAQFESMRRLAFLLGADDPENVAQESFARLHSRWLRLRDRRHALAYLRATVTNLSRSRLRHLGVVRRTTVSQVTNDDSAEVRVIARHGPLWRALDSLSLRQRQVVVLRYWLDLPLAETAATLDLSVGTVKATQSQAIAKLRTLLETEEEW